MDIDEKVRLLGMGYTREQCDAIDAARQADSEKPRGRQRRS